MDHNHERVAVADPVASVEAGQVAALEPLLAEGDAGDAGLAGARGDAVDEAFRAVL